MTARHQGRMLVFVGSYAEADHDGVYVYSFDEDSGQLALLDRVAGLKNPTFLNVDIRHLKLYAIAEGATGQGQRVGEAVSFAIDPVKGTLTELNRSLSVDAPTCHIQRDAGNRHLVVASYHGGKVGLLSLGEDGRVGRLLDVKQHEGRSVHPERQNQPHPHSACFSPDNRYLFVPDLGLDRVRAYTIDRSRNLLQWHADIELHPGAGPRHMAFHPAGSYAFVINEIDSTMTSFRYDAEAGRLHPIETVPTLPPDFRGGNTCAEVALSDDGKFVYGSNRGHDSIVVYAFDAAMGKLAFVEHVSTEGKHPRHFAWLPDGKHIIAANRDTDNLAVFRADRSTGKLRFTGHTARVSKPVCVQAAYMPV